MKLKQIINYNKKFLIYKILILKAFTVNSIISFNYIKKNLKIKEIFS